MIKPVVQPGEAEHEFFDRAIPLVYASEKNQTKVVAACNSAWKNRAQ